MKKNILLKAFIVSIIMTLFSCSFINDKKIDAFENSIDKLAEEYKEMTAEELEKAISICEEQKESLNEKKDKFNKEQTKRIANLEGRYQNVLVRIQLYTKMNDLLDVTEVESTIQYIKGLLTNE